MQEAGTAEAVSLTAEEIVQEAQTLSKIQRCESNGLGQML